MQSKKIEKTVFITEDGREFDNELVAKRHEEKIALIKELSRYLPNKKYIVLYIPAEPTVEILNKVAKTFVLDNVNELCSGWNLIIDNEENAHCIPLEKLLIPKKAVEVPALSQEEQIGVMELKKRIYGIIARNSKMQATAEGILGNIMMDLQDLIK